MSARVSVALIVRDEAFFLPGFFEALRPLEAELVVLDTGSNDGSAGIARAAGARVEHFAWCDDFSAARNAAIALCSGAWVFALDADERLEPAGLEAVRALAAGAPDCAYRFVTRNYTRNAGLAEFTACAPDDPRAQGFPGWFPSAKVRLFPNRPDIRFEGAVHETVQPALARAGVPVTGCAVPIHHYAAQRDAARIAAKGQLYLRLGAAKAAAHPGDAQAHAELGNQYAELGDPARAAACYREALRCDPANAAHLAELGALLFLAGRPAEARQALTLATARPEAPASAWRNLGIVHAHAQDWAAALPCFAEAAARAPMHPEGARYYALALAQCGRHAEAAAAARRALELAPWSAEAAALHADLMRGEFRGHDT